MSLSFQAHQFSSASIGPKTPTKIGELELQKMRRPIEGKHFLSWQLFFRDNKCFCHDKQVFLMTQFVCHDRSFFWSWQNFGLSWQKCIVILNKLMNNHVKVQEELTRDFCKLNSIVTKFLIFSSWIQLSRNSWFFSSCIKLSRSSLPTTSLARQGGCWREKLKEAWTCYRRHEGAP